MMLRWFRTRIERWLIGLVRRSVGVRLRYVERSLRRIEAEVRREPARSSPLLPPAPLLIGSIGDLTPAGMIRARRGRDRFLPVDLFGEPGWDILLDLHLQRSLGAEVSVSSLCVAAAVAQTTALRWIGRMVDAGVLERHGDATDRRRAWISLAPDTVDRLDRYFAWLASQPAIAARAAGPRPELCR